MGEIPKEIIERVLAGMKVSYTVETVYSCIKKGDTVEIEDNRDKFKRTGKTKKKLQ